MKTIKTSIAIGTGALMMLINTGVVFGADLKINKTGAKSFNMVSVSTKCVDSVTQSNVSNVVNQVSIAQNTGNNSASKNTGSGMVVTGNAAAMVMIANGGSSNELLNHGEGCCCGQHESVAPVSQVSNTGYKSVNKVVVSNTTVSKLLQSNLSSKLTGIGVAQETGMNKSNKNTGDGSVGTGVVEVGVEILNEADSNTN